MLSEKDADVGGDGECRAHIPGGGGIYFPSLTELHYPEEADIWTL